MSSKHNTSENCCRGHAGARLVVLLALLLLGSGAAADDAGAWRLEPAVDIRTATYFVHSGGASKTYPTVGVELSVELSSPVRPVTAGLFANHELTTRADDKFTQLVGSWVSYRYGRWKLSTVAARFKSNQVDGLWMHASKLQFELRPGHKLALQGVGIIGGSSNPALQLVYNTRVFGRASVAVSIGLGSNRSLDFGASTKLVWNLY